jgi:excisionase family DNA binding protein
MSLLTAREVEQEMPGLSRPMEILDAEAVAKMLGMTTDWIYAEARAGRIPHIRLGRYVRFRRESIEAWLLEAECGKIARTS